MFTLLFDIEKYLVVTKKFFFIKNFNIHKILHSGIHGKDNI